MLQTTTALAGGSLLAGLAPDGLLAQKTATPRADSAQQAGGPAAAVRWDSLAAAREEVGKTPLQTQKLSDSLTLLYGPGGNVVVLNGPDGKVMVDTCIAPAAAKLKETLDGLGNAPLKFVINTHWHWDHTDNNGVLHAAGATILAHENTRKRLGETHELALLGAKTFPSPVAALPQQTFRDTFRLYFNSEQLELVHIPPSHTDTDVFIHYQKANVLHLGDVFFNGMYPYIDGGTGGSINGVIAGATKALGMADNNTKIVPGHGPVGDKAALLKYRDMLVTARDRVKKEKAAGKTLKEVLAAKPTTDLDATWGWPIITPEYFVTLVYTTL